MTSIVRGIFILACLLPYLCSTAYAQAPAKAAFDFKSMGDMSDFDPANPVIPTGDTIKIAVVASFSGPAALVGQIYWASAPWAAHDINKRGGIMVDGKKKLVEVIKADHMSKPDQAKKICERMVLQEKVNVLWGTDGSNLQKIINETANKYKVIAINTASLSDELQDATNFSPLCLPDQHVRRPARPRPRLLLRTRSGRRRRSFTSCARTTCSDTSWPRVSRRG